MGTPARENICYAKEIAGRIVWRTLWLARTWFGYIPTSLAIRKLMPGIEFLTHGSDYHSVVTAWSRFLESLQAIIPA